MREALVLYGRALEDGAAISGPASPRIEFEDGAASPFPVGRFLAGADPLDRRLLDGVQGPVLDVGCGPGRHLHELSGRGVYALGVDLSAVAVDLACSGGARAMVADIFGDVPGAGSWRTALLLDGNIGIGGDPVRLLTRLRSLLTDEGVALVELDPPGSGTPPPRARLELAGESSDWFAWARVPACKVVGLAADAGMVMEWEWNCAGTLVRPAPVGRPGLSLPAGGAKRVAAWGARLVVLVALAPIAVYVWAAIHRLGYPYELDSLEGGGVEIVRRVIDGRSLYTPPTLAYVSYTYTPFYAWVSAAVAEVTGVGFLPLRLVSLGSSLVAFWALARLTLEATGDRVAAVVAAGVFAGTYSLSGWFFDVGRLDSLFVALTLVALWLGRRAEGVRAGAVVGAVAFLAFFTKQIGLVAVVPALVWLALMRPRAGAAALVTLLVLTGGSTLVLDALTHGWYRYYVVGELAGQAWDPLVWGRFWTHSLYRHLGPLAWLAAVALAFSLTIAVRKLRRGSERGRALSAMRSVSGSELGVGYEFAVITGLVLAAWFSRLHTGGYINVLMPAYAACGLIGGLAYARVRRIGPLPALAATVLILVQLAQLLALPNHGLPFRSVRAAGDQLMTRLQSLPGPVLVLSHPWYAALAGKGSYAQSDAIVEVLRSDDTRGAGYLRRDLRDALDRYRIRAVVLDHPPPSWLEPQLARDFTLQPQPITSTPLRPPADLRSWPMLLYVRKSSG